MSKVVAPVHDRHPRLERVAAHDGQLLADRPGGVLGRKYAPVFREHGVQQLREAPELVGIEDPVHMAVAGFDALGDGGLPHHAAAEENFLLRVATLGVHERADVPVHAVLRVLAHGTGVDDDAVCALLGVAHGVARRAQQPPDTFGVRLVLLTAVGVHERQRRAATRAPVFRDARAESFLLRPRLSRDLGDPFFHAHTSAVKVSLR